MAAILYGIVTYLLQQVVIKFVIFTALFFCVSSAVSWLQQYMFSGDGGISAAITGMGGSFTVLGQTINSTSEIEFFLNYFLIPQWLEALLVAYATVFVIRRIPFIN